MLVAVVPFSGINKTLVGISLQQEIQRLEQTGANKDSTEIKCLLACVCLVGLQTGHTSNAGVE